MRTTNLLAHLDALSAAVSARDLERVKALITGPGSSRIPRRVREEVLTVAGLPKESLRAPMALFAFYYQTSQLMMDESAPLDRGQDRGQLELPLAKARRRRRTA